VPKEEDPQQLNRYAYTRNNPLKYTDPTGHRIDDGCQTEGCAGDEDWAVNILREVAQSSASFGPVNAPLIKFAHGFFLDTLRNYTSDAGPMTLDGAARDAMHAASQKLNDDARLGWSPEEAWEKERTLGISSKIIAALIADHLMGNVGNAAADVLVGSDLAEEDYFGEAPCSFSADTLVATDDGKQAIATLKVGDRVLAYNTTLGVNGYYTVTAVLAHNDPIIEYLMIDGEKIDTTPEHPFYTLVFGWLHAGELQAGIHVRKANGGYGTVQAVQLVRRTQPMYNLTVAQAHTFFVGEQQWLVHNQCETEFGTWYGKGGWQTRMNEYGNEIRVKQLTKQDVKNLGLELLKQRGYKPMDNIYGDADGGLWITNEEGDLVDFLQ